MGRKTIILIGKDDVLKTVAKLLRTKKCQVVRAVDGREAMDALALEQHASGMVISEQLDVSRCASAMQVETQNGKHAGVFVAKTARRIGYYIPFVFLAEEENKVEQQFKDEQMMDILSPTTEAQQIVDCLITTIENRYYFDISKGTRKIKIKNPLATIGLVYSDDHLAELVSLVLPPKGYACQRLGCSYEAMPLLKKELPDMLIVLNLMMPVMNGFEFVKAVREKWPREKLPILVISNFGRMKEKDRYIDAYMSKPLDLDELLETVESLRRLKKGIADQTANS